MRDKPFEDPKPQDITALIEHFADMPDFRIERNKRHALLDILTLSLCAIIAGAEGWRDIESYGNAKESSLRDFLKLENGIPSHDTIEYVFAKLDPEAFSQRFMSWVASLAEKPEGEGIAFDGKRLRGSKGEALKPLHLVSAWASERRLVLGQARVDGKSNEITAIPELLETLDVSGCVVTIDAMGCQRSIAQKIVDKGGDYLLALKGNQPTLYRLVVSRFASGEADASYEEITEKPMHGRHERRHYRVIHQDLGELQALWPHLGSIICVESEREVKGKLSTEQRYYLSSLQQPQAQEVARRVRGHWGIENELHWVLDVAFREDASPIRTGHAAQNLAILRHMALNLLKHERSSRRGIAAKRKQAGWDDAYMLKVLQARSPQPHEKPSAPM